MFRSFAAAALILIAPAFVSAQVNTGTISGVVKDSSGGVLPGASVKIVRDGGNAAEASIDLVATGDGSYRTEPLGVGAYRVAASLDGFETIERRVAVSAG